MSEGELTPNEPGQIRNDSPTPVPSICSGEIDPDDEDHHIGFSLEEIETSENQQQQEPGETENLGILIRNLPLRSSDTSLRDGLFHEYKKYGKVTLISVEGQEEERYAIVSFKKPEEAQKALEASQDKIFFGGRITVTSHEGVEVEDADEPAANLEDMNEYHPKATRTLYVKNLEKEVSAQQLKEVFKSYGAIINIDIKKQGAVSAYAFVEYTNIKSVIKAMRKMNGGKIGQNEIKLGFGKSMPTKCVWLDGVAESVGEKFLCRKFSRHGFVSHCVIDKIKGRALVYFDSSESASYSVNEMRGYILNGQKIQIDFASRDCQTAFFEKMERSGQLQPGERPDGRYQSGDFYESEGCSSSGRGSYTAPWHGRGRGRGGYNYYDQDDTGYQGGWGRGNGYKRYDQPRGYTGRGGQMQGDTGYGYRGRGGGYRGGYNQEGGSRGAGSSYRRGGYDGGSKGYRGGYNQDSSRHAYHSGYMPASSRGSHGSASYYYQEGSGGGGYEKRGGSWHGNFRQRGSGRGSYHSGQDDSWSGPSRSYYEDSYKDSGEYRESSRRFSRYDEYQEGSRRGDSYDLQPPEYKSSSHGYWPEERVKKHKHHRSLTPSRRHVSPCRTVSPYRGSISSSPRSVTPPLRLRRKQHVLRRSVSPYAQPMSPRGGSITPSSRSITPQPQSITPPRKQHRRDDITPPYLPAKQRRTGSPPLDGALYQRYGKKYGACHLDQVWSNESDSDDRSLRSYRSNSSEPRMKYSKRKPPPPDDYYVERRSKEHSYESKKHRAEWNEYSPNPNQVLKKRHKRDYTPS